MGGKGSKNKTELSTFRDQIFLIVMFYPKYGGVVSDKSDLGSLL